MIDNETCLTVSVHEAEAWLLTRELLLIRDK